MCLFSKYRDLFGQPGLGFHSTRFAGVALFDLVGTVAIAGVFVHFAIRPPDRTRWVVCFIQTLLTLLVLAIILHRLFCVNTALNVGIFGTVYM